MRSASLKFRPFGDERPAPSSQTQSKLAALLTLAAMSLGYGVVQLDVTIVNTALHAIGSSLGGGVAELQWVVNAYTIAFAALILTAGALGDRIGAKRIFMTGFALFTAASLACAIIEGGAAGWDNPLVISGFGVSALFAALFVWQESRAPQPMLPLSLFRQRMFALTSLVGLLVNVAIYGLIFVLSLYFQQFNGLSAFETGLAFVPMMAAVLPVNLIAPHLAERIGAPATIAVGATLSAIGCLATLGI